MNHIIIIHVVNIKAFKYFLNVNNHSNQSEVNMDELHEHIILHKAECGKTK